MNESQEQQSANSDTGGGCGTLSIAAFLVALKLSHVIDWPWYVVLLPLYLEATLVLLGFIVGLLTAALGYLLKLLVLLCEDVKVVWNSFWR